MHRLCIFLFCLIFSEGIALAAQESLLHQFFMGNTEIWVLSLGWNEQKTAILLPHTDAEKAAIASTYPQGTMRNSQNVLLIRGNGLVILVDTGFARSAELQAALLRAGSSAAEVTHIILTHAHEDHTGGLLQGNRAAFPNAKLLFPKAELAYWLAPANRQKTPNAFLPIFANLPKILAAYKNRIFGFVPGEDLFAELPGIQALDAAGHTPGHVAIMIQKDRRTLLFWGDLMHAFDVQTKFPDISTTYDLDTGKAATVRAEMLQRAAAEGWLISGSHLPFVQPRTLP